MFTITHSIPTISKEGSVDDSPTCNSTQTFGICANTWSPEHHVSFDNLGTWNRRKNFNSLGAAQALQWKQNSLVANPQDVSAIRQIKEYSFYTNKVNPARNSLLDLLGPVLQVNSLHSESIR